MLMRDCGLDAGLEMDILSIFWRHREQFALKSSNKSRSKQKPDFLIIVLEQKNKYTAMTLLGKQDLQHRIA
jgi:hypothetical protein